MESLIELIPAKGVSVEVRAGVTHLCPYKEEDDTAEVRIQWRCNGSSLEFHALADYLETFASVVIAQEDLVKRLQEVLERQAGISDVSVTYIGETAGMEVRVSSDALSS